MSPEWALLIETWSQCTESGLCHIPNLKTFIASGQDADTVYL